MNFKPVKAADLREGDVIRWTGEGVVEKTQSCINEVWVKFAGADAGYCSNAMRTPCLDAGTLERQERPLEVGETLDLAGVSYEVVAPPRGARPEVALWSDKYGYCGRYVDTLAREQP